MALHRAFNSAGFSELASEWWHFGDEDTEKRIQAIVGSEGLDFVA
jgi:D-alanyl-D-alanine dipeptidase